MAMSEQKVVSGHIETEKIKKAHETIRNLVHTYDQELRPGVTAITLKAKQNWVGKGRNEFESQYNLIIRKIEDLGDVLNEIYQGLVNAEADYATEDNDLKQDFNANIENLKGN